MRGSFEALHKGLNDLLHTRVYVSNDKNKIC